MQIAQTTTLPELFQARVAATPDLIAYRQFDATANDWKPATWQQMQEKVAQYQQALQQEKLHKGDRIAIWLRNCMEWVCLDQAALALGFVVVPLYTDDRAENCAYILENANAKLLLLGTADQWASLAPVQEQLRGVQRIVSVVAITSDDARLQCLPDWLQVTPSDVLQPDIHPQDIATIVYTSGTTGRPKGVILTHHNILWNAKACLLQCPVFEDDVLLSFLPLSHTFERTVGYYAAMAAGAMVNYARSIPQLGEDLQAIRPTMMISVPRIFERVYAKIQNQLEQKSPFAKKLFLLTVEVGWKRFLYQQRRGGWSPRFLLWPLLHQIVAKKVLAKLGGRLRAAISGGAALNPAIAKFFIGLGVPLIQGYGLTESSPVLTANKIDDNIPSSVGLPIVDVEIHIADNGELLVRSPGVTQGYWKNEEATRQLIDQEGWLHTGDKACIDEGHVFITGRLKEIIVLANGEKVPPCDMEAAISLDPLFEQVMVLGEAKPYLTAIITLDPEHWTRFAQAVGCNAEDPASLTNSAILSEVLKRIAMQLHAFPGYAQIRRVNIQTEAWTVDNRLLTPTMKLRRAPIAERFATEIERLYAGH